jgi:hypothetical protein
VRWNLVTLGSWIFGDGETRRQNNMSEETQRLEMMVYL